MAKRTSAKGLRLFAEYLGELDNAGVFEQHPSNALIPLVARVVQDTERLIRREERGQKNERASGYGRRKVQVGLLPAER